MLSLTGIQPNSYLIWPASTMPFTRQNAGGTFGFGNAKPKPAVPQQKIKPVKKNRPRISQEPIILVASLVTGRAEQSPVFAFSEPIIIQAWGIVRLAKLLKTLINQAPFGRNNPYIEHAKLTYKSLKNHVLGVLYKREDNGHVIYERPTRLPKHYRVEITQPNVATPSIAANNRKGGRLTDAQTLSDGGVHYMLTLLPNDTDDKARSQAAQRVTSGNYHACSAHGRIILFNKPKQAVCSLRNAPKKKADSPAKPSAKPSSPKRNKKNNG